MKRILSISLSIIFVLFVNQSLQAQTVVEQGDITVGGGLTFTTGFGAAGSGEVGVNVNGYYSITDEIRAGASLSLFFGDFSPTQFNIDGHYLFINEEELVVYGLAGIGFWTWSYDFDTQFGSFGSGSVSTSGLNLGGGAEYDMGNFALFGEAKVSTIGGTPFNLTGGVRLRF